MMVAAAGPDRPALLVAGETCWRTVHTERFSRIVDGADYLYHVKEAMLAARRRIMIDRVGPGLPDGFRSATVDVARAQQSRTVPAMAGVAASRTRGVSAQVEPAAAARFRRVLVRGDAGQLRQPDHLAAHALRRRRCASDGCGAPPEGRGGRRRGGVLRRHRPHPRPLGHPRAHPQRSRPVRRRANLRAAPRGRGRGRRRRRAQPGRAGRATGGAPRPGRTWTRCPSTGRCGRRSWSRPCATSRSASPARCPRCAAAARSARSRR